MEFSQIEKLFQEGETSKTNNPQFDDSGFVLVRKLFDPKELECDVPKERGLFHYYGSEEKFTHEPVEDQVKGSVARYYWPRYKEAHHKFKKKIEEVIGKKLYTTYYYDRFYFPGQALDPHTDRGACEISITVHIGTNLNQPWGFWVKNGKGEHCKIYMEPGDGVIYKGCERLHWRDPMPENKQPFYKKWFSKKEDLYYHQAFFHYVLADGSRAHCAFDAAR